MDPPNEKRITHIAYNNDTLRIHHVCGEIELSPLVKAQSESTQQIIFQAIAQFDDFNPRVDPNGHHDFGSVEIKGEYYYFLMQYKMDIGFSIRQQTMKIIHSSETNFYDI